MTKVPTLQIDFYGNILIQVEVHPNSSKNGIYGYNKWRDCLKIFTKSEAIQGQANKETIKILVNFFNLKKKDVKIIQGQSNKLKKIKIINGNVILIKNKILEVLEVVI